MGAAAIQVHPTPPNYWGSPKLDEDRIARFKAAAEEAGRPPFYFHAVYLINLAGDEPVLRQRSESTLTGYLKAADELGVDGVIFHTGSHKGAGFEACLPTIVGHLTRVMERADPKRAHLLIENNAGLGGCVGARFEEVRALLDAVDDPRTAVCFDTCHAFASGYDIRTPEGVDKTLDELDHAVGLERVECIHANDSQTGLSWRRSELAGAPIYTRFFDAAHGVVVTEPAAAGRNSAQLWTTSDAGAHWSRAQLPAAPHAAYPQAFFSDLEHGWEMRVGSRN